MVVHRTIIQCKGGRLLLTGLAPVNCGAGGTEVVLDAGRPLLPAKDTAGELLGGDTG